MRTEDHVDHDDGLNEQDNGNNNGRDNDDTTINCWRRFGGVDTRERDELGRRWVKFSFEDEDDVDRIDDGTMGRTAATMTAATTTTRINISTMQASNTTTTMATATAMMAIVMKTMALEGTRTNQQSTTAR
jgi:hypothetical protein